MIASNFNHSVIDRTYYLRFFFLSASFSFLLALFAIYAVDMPVLPLIMVIGFLIANTLLFPFARASFDSFLAFAFGDDFVFVSILGSLFINFHLWAFTFIFAPLYFLGVIAKLAVRKL